MQASEFNYLLNRLSFDRRAFDKLYAYFFARIVMHVQMRFSKADFAEDIAQEFFIKILTLKNVSYVKYPTAWVYRVCDNLAYDHLAKQPQQVDIDSLVLCADSVDHNETDNLKRILSKLSEIEREIIVMRVIEGYSFVEIGTELKLNVNTVKSHYRRGLAQAQTLYKKNDR